MALPRGLLELLGLLKASWSGLGALLEPWAAGTEQNLVLIGSWPGQGHQGDWFRIAWGPNGRPKGAQESLKTGPKRELR